jgi:threonine/homoserine/homoserine lactone efflux protein
VTLQFLLTALLVVITPGTGVIYVLAAGLARGAQAGLIASVGCTFGIVPHMLAAITGLAALLNTSTIAFQVLKYLGVAYLLYLSWSVLRDKDALVVQEDEERRPAAKVIGEGILVNFLNPKLTIFFFAFLPQFVSPSDPNSLLRLIELSIVFMLLTFVVFVGYGWFAAAIRVHVISRPQALTWMRRAFAAAFVALGLSLLTYNSG